MPPLSSDALQQQIHDLRNQLEVVQSELKIAQERYAELETWALAEFESDRTRLARTRSMLRILRDATTLAIGGVGLIIALWSATPEVRAETAKTWIAGISALGLGALSATMQIKKDGRDEN